MDRVIDRLWVGSSADLDAGLSFRTLGFSGVVDLRDGVQPKGLDVQVFRLKNRDGDAWALAEVERALDFVVERIRWGRVLIACAAGISRSASLAVGYLVRAGWDAPSAMEAVRRARPIVSPVSAMMDSVLRAVAMGVEVPEDVPIAFAYPDLCGNEGKKS